MDMLEVLVCIWIIVIQFPLISLDRELAQIRVVYNIGVYKGLWEGN